MYKWQFSVPNKQIKSFSNKQHNLYIQTFLIYAVGIITTASKWVGTLGSFTDYVYKRRGVGGQKTLKLEHSLWTTPLVVVVSDWILTKIEYAQDYY